MCWMMSVNSSKLPNSLVRKRSRQKKRMFFAHPFIRHKCIWAKKQQIYKNQTARQAPVPNKTRIHILFLAVVFAPSIFQCLRDRFFSLYSHSLHCLIDLSRALFSHMILFYYDTSNLLSSEQESDGERGNQTHHFHFPAYGIICTFTIPIYMKILIMYITVATCDMYTSICIYIYVSLGYPISHSVHWADSYVKGNLVCIRSKPHSRPRRQTQ